MYRTHFLIFCSLFLGFVLVVLILWLAPSSDRISSWLSSRSPRSTLFDFSRWQKRKRTPKPRVVITGIAHNVFHALPKVRECIMKTIQNTVEDYFIFFYENDSTDGTDSFLQNWAREDSSHMFVKTEKLGRSCARQFRQGEILGQMTSRLAEYRNRCLEWIRTQKNLEVFDCLWILDLDLEHGWDTKQVSERVFQRWCFSSGPYAFDNVALGVNGLMGKMPYDILAFRSEEDGCGLGPGAMGEQAYWLRSNLHRLKRKMYEKVLQTRESETSQGICPVQSCFGGMGFYPLGRALQSSYQGYLDPFSSIPDCEHVSFHFGLFRENDNTRGDSTKLFGFFMDCEISPQKGSHRYDNPDDNVF